MDSILIEIAKNMPVAGALIFLVVIFLKAMDKRDSRITEVIDTNKRVMDIVLDKHSVAMDAIIVKHTGLVAEIQKDWTASLADQLTRVSVCIDRNTDALISFKAMAEKCRTLSDK